MNKGLAYPEGDPNFPEEGLNIKPSYERYGSRSQSRHEWACDSRDDIEKFGIAGRVWEAAYLLQRYLDHLPGLEFDPPFHLLIPCSSAPQQHGETVLELGAGAGVAGLHLAQALQSNADQRSTVILTDLENVLPLLKRNVSRCALDPEQQIKVRPLPWGSSAHAEAIVAEQCEAGSPIKHILCSDLVYFPELLPPLLRSLIQLTTATQATVTISYKIRSLAKEEPFWRVFGVWFTFYPVLCRRRGGKDSEWRRFGGLKIDLFDQTDDNESEAEDDLFVFVAERKYSTYAAPQHDTDLMTGYMLDQNGELVNGTGSEQFELIMMNLLQA